MKMLIYGLVISFGLLANDAQAQGEPTLTIDGKEYPVSVLMNNCQNISDQPEAQIACFNAISQLLEAQNGVQESGETSVPQALEALQDAAQFDNGETGLSIIGSNCNIQIGNTRFVAGSLVCALPVERLDVEVLVNEPLC